MAKISLVKGGYKVSGKSKKFGVEGGKDVFVPRDSNSDTNPEEASLPPSTESTGFTPTVLTNSNIVENVIPQLNADANSEIQNYNTKEQIKASAKPKKQDDLSTLFGSSQKEDPIVTRQLSLIDKMLKSNDSYLNAYGESIQSNFDDRRARLEQQQEASKEGVENTLLLGGGARYAPISSQGLLDEVERSNIRSLTELDNQERMAILDLKRAQDDRNFQLLGTKLDLLGQIRKEKQDTINAALQAQAEERKQLDKDINGVLTDLAKNNAPQDVRAAVANAPDLGSAISAAGDWLESATGTAGEYLFYKRDAIRNGQVPMSPNDYFTLDANRKRPVVNVGNSGLSSGTITQIDKLSSSFDTNPITKNYVEVQNKKLTVDSIINSGIKGPGDLAIVYEFMKALDPTSVVRETEYATAAKSGNIFSGVMARFNGYMSEGGGFLPPQVRKDFQNIVGQKFDVADTQYKNLKSETARKINMKTGADDGEDFLTNYEGASSTASAAIDQEDVAKQKVIEYGKFNTAYRQQIIDLSTQNQPDLGRPYTYAEISQILGIQ